MNGKTYVIKCSIYGNMINECQTRKETNSNYICQKCSRSYFEERGPAPVETEEIISENKDVN